MRPRPLCQESPGVPAAVSRSGTPFPPPLCSSLSPRSQQPRVCLWSRCAFWACGQHKTGVWREPPATCDTTTERRCRFRLCQHSGAGPLTLSRAPWSCSRARLLLLLGGQGRPGAPRGPREHGDGAERKPPGPPFCAGASRWGQPRFAPLQVTWDPRLCFLLPGRCHRVRCGWVRGRGREKP